MDLVALTEREGRAAAAIVLKVSRALPRHAGSNLRLFVQFQTLVLRLASLLPSHDVDGLGDSQADVVNQTLAAVLPLARQAIASPLAHMSVSMNALLRELAAGSDAHQREWTSHPNGAAVAGAAPLKTTPFVAGVVDRELAYSITRAELAYETLLSGIRYLATMNRSQFLASVDHGLWHVTSSVLFWVPPLLFDGLRLRRGLEIAAPCGIPFPGQRAPFGLDGPVTRFLSDGETSTDRERVGRTAQFFIAAASAGWVAYSDSSFVNKAAALRVQLTTSLAECRAEQEQRAPMPGKSLRIILDAFATAAEHSMFDEASLRMFQLAFGFPCLLPSRLHPLKGYDGGLLSVWDACNHLIHLYAQEHQLLLSIHGAMCAVLGGLVGSLMADEKKVRLQAGPFYVAHDDVVCTIQELEREWPPVRLPALPERGVSPRAVLRTDQRGKMVSATAALCEAMQTNVYKAEPKPSPLMRARFEAAFSMLSVTDMLNSECGVYDSKPTDGIVGLKRLYFVALHHEPWLPDGRTMEHAGNSFWETSPLSDGHPGNIPCVIAHSSIECAWREILGGACLSTGMLFASTQRGLSDSLTHDWLPLEVVKRTLKARAAGRNERPGSVMLPSVAMGMASERAKAHVVDAVSMVDNRVKTIGGPVYVTRVLELLNGWALCVYRHSDLNPLWESVLTHFCPMAPSGKKRSRSPGIEAVLQDGCNTISMHSVDNE